MLTAVRFGPNDHGRLVTDEELEAADYLGGYDYEVIFGRLYVSPAPNREHDVVEKHIYNQIDVYSVEHPEVIGYVTDRARVFVPFKSDEAQLNGGHLQVLVVTGPSRTPLELPSGYRSIPFRSVPTRFVASKWRLELKNIRIKPRE